MISPLMAISRRKESSWLITSVLLCMFSEGKDEITGLGIQTEIEMVEGDGGIPGMGIEVVG